MDKQLTNNEKARVFAMHLGCHFRYRFTDYEPGVWAIGATLTLSRLERVMSDASVDDIQLLLKSLHSITDEDAIEMLQQEYSHIKSGYESTKIRRSDKGRIEIEFRYKNPDPKRNLSDGFYYSSWAWNGSTHESWRFQYLISKGYAVPLWFGIDHWANGKTAIDLGLAIEKQTN